MRATRLKQTILTYLPAPGYDTVKWRDDMLCMFNELTDADPTAMTDHEFARHLVTMMRKDGEWQYTSSQLADEMTKAELARKPLSSSYVLDRLKAEDERQQNPESSTSVLMTARTEFNAKYGTTGPKRPREPILAYSAPSNSKRPREHYTQTSPRPICDNEYCERPVGHSQKDCFVYKGGKQGQYPEWYKGSKLVHLPPTERARIRRDDEIARAQTRQTRQANFNNPNPPSYTNSTLTTARPTTTSASAHNFTTNVPSRSQLVAIDSADSDNTVCANLAQDSIPQIILNTYVDANNDSVCQCSPTVFNTTLAKQTAIFHDTGATKHVSYDKSLLHSYELLDNPVRVNGFGSELSATAPGKGRMMLRTKVNGDDTILILNNVLHVPSGRVHLISGSELDKKGISTWISNGKISLLKSDSVVARGSLWNDLYKLNLIPIPVNNHPPPLLQRIQSRSLIERIDTNEFDRVRGAEEMAAALKLFNNGSTKSDFYTV